MLNRTLITLLSFSLLGLVSVVPIRALQDDDTSQDETPTIRYIPRWDLQPSGVNDDLHAVAFTDTLHGWAVGQNNTVIRTTDGGATWTRIVDRRDRGPEFDEVSFVDQ